MFRQQSLFAFRFQKIGSMLIDAGKTEMPVSRFSADFVVKHAFLQTPAIRDSVEWRGVFRILFCVRVVAVVALVKPRVELSDHFTLRSP